MRQPRLIPIALHTWPLPSSTGQCCILLCHHPTSSLLPCTASFCIYRSAAPHHLSVALGHCSVRIHAHSKPCHDSRDTQASLTASVSGGFSITSSGCKQNHSYCLLTHPAATWTLVYVGSIFSPISISFSLLPNSVNISAAEAKRQVPFSSNGFVAQGHRRDFQVSCTLHAPSGPASQQGCIPKCLKGIPCGWSEASQLQRSWAGVSLPALPTGKRLHTQG